MCLAHIHGRILMIYTSYDVFWRKKVPYGDRVDTDPHDRDEIPPKKFSLGSV